MITLRFGSRRGTVLLGIGLLVAGVTLSAYATYRLGWGSAATAAEAREMSTQVRLTWNHQRTHGKPAGEPAPGQTLALLRIPELGPTYEVAIAEGVDDDVLDRGLAGHVPGTALPGQAGNFAIAGHRVTHGEPFRHLDLLRPGDPIVVETMDTTYTYLVVNDPVRSVVGPDDTWVTDPVPGAARGTDPGQALLTLATCPSVWNAQQRMVVFARLATASPKPGRGKHGE